ncbi:hypothetical protein [Halobacteriovorax sp. HLS]|uniref:hypothetical protein n=1 Tax=Halobacteriovorax sp. HLS TaxID=2234000 RepID=UPI000FDB5E80|nr:hypothetical protein [Halobacteriovorax sp. HLS]
MKLTYLPKWAYFLFLFFLVFLTANLGIMGLVAAAIVMTFFVLVFRSSSKDLKEDSSVSEDIVFSPVNGKVNKVLKNTSHEFFGENFTSVEIQVPFWKELGLFFPATSEVEQVRSSCEKCPDHLIVFKMTNGLEIGLAVGQNILRLLPRIVVLPGDRGKQKMNFGYLPFGGQVRVYIPSSLEVLINEKDEVVAGQGVLAGIPKKIED